MKEKNPKMKIDTKKGRQGLEHLAWTQQLA